MAHAVAVAVLAGWGLPAGKVSVTVPPVAAVHVVALLAGPGAGQAGWPEQNRRQNPVVPGLPARHGLVVLHFGAQDFEAKCFGARPFLEWHFGERHFEE